jgi:arsenite-transporting ATPase
MRQIFPQEVVTVIEEQLSSPCTEEIAAFDKFIDFMNQPQYDIIIFDTAPTGHTLRLLELPLDWKKSIELSEAGSGQTCIGSVQTLKETKAKYEKAISLMRSPQAKFVFVLQPDSTAIYETKRSISALENIGIRAELLIVNGVLPHEQCVDPFFKRRRDMQERYLEQIKQEFTTPILTMELLDTEIKGLGILEKVGTMLHEDSRAVITQPAK